MPAAPETEKVAAYQPGARVIACLNSPFLSGGFVEGQMARRAPRVAFEATMPVSEDFPDRYPDRGLKISRFRFR